MSDIAISAGVRQNLLSLQSTADMMSQTQNRLATGKKVNSALDNPSSYFTASGLNNRASDMNALMDGMANGIKTLEAADNGLSAITKTLESMQSTLRQARQDKSFETQSFSLNPDDIDTSSVQTLSLSGGAVGETAVSVDLNAADTAATAATVTGAGGTDWATGTDTFEATASGGEFDDSTITIADADGNTISSYQVQTGDTVADVTSALSTGDMTVTGTASGFDFSNANGENFTVSTDDAALTTAIGVGTTDTSVDGVEATTGEVKTVDQLVDAINSATDLDGKIRASNDDGRLRIENQSTQELTVEGVADGSVDGGSTTAAIDGNSVRAGLADQYNELRDQLDKLADDASFNGVNLLRGDNLQITFNETGTSELNIQTEGGETINSANLGIPTEMGAADFDSDAGIDGFLQGVKTAINDVRAQSSSFGSSLSIVENRSDFTTNMVNTLQTGGDNLTLADSNEEAANLLALQTRQQLSSTALSMASQQDQAVLRLF